MDNPDEWARSLGEEIRSKHSVERDIAQTVAMNREIEAEKMPLKWEEVIAAFQTCCTAYNQQVKPQQRLDLHRGSPREFIIRPDVRPEIVTGKYDAHRRWIEIISSAGKEIYFPQVVHAGSGDVELVSLQTKRVKNPVNIAQDTIRECLIAP